METTEAWLYLSLETVIGIIILSIIGIIVINIFKNINQLYNYIENDIKYILNTTRLIIRI
ncbi:hypothetical protein TTX_0982 [Thermoproteus tenax Kra 1]|uniref:Uncharacterized protein n=1 Tax=Thermoproteus tenax (strain ATCC 35583 / DSM 2078 / JCM 9277 / NBRC 100435 / Kra 1) TaxID=768679 RepID=G4RPY6_THETK|nr:hypothetical protein TTX_0982 [Thermoproteus tenax Kra 1]